MYAIIQTGGKQYRVKKDDVIDVELLEAELGANVHFKDVLFIGNGSKNEVGGPMVSGYVVHGEIVEQVAGPKVVSVKYKPSHNERRKWGHRQKYHRVKITEIRKS